MYDVLNTTKIYHGTTKMIAHRGVSRLECQNTAAAFVAAGNRSYYGVESDVRISADGVCFMFHDGDVAPRVMGGEEYVNVLSLSWEELSQLRLFDWDGVQRNDLRIPLLTDYLRICSHYKKTPILEIKDPMTADGVKYVCEVVRENFPVDDLVFIAFNPDHLRTVREVFPTCDVQYLTNKTIDDELIALLEKECWDIDTNHEFVTKGIVDTLHAKGIKINCWTVDDPVRGQQLCNWGVDFITTNVLE